MNDATKLSRRQLECLVLVARGDTSAEIGQALGISRRTIDHYVANTCARLGVRNRTQAVAKAIVNGLIESPAAPELRGTEQLKISSDQGTIATALSPDRGIAEDN